MNDFVWVLRHPTNLVTKTWKADGTIQEFDDAKNYIGTERTVSNVRDLSALLVELESEPHCCVIRGKYRGYEHSLIAEPTDTKKGRVLRRMSVHEDVPHHWMMVDIDSYRPFDYDPLLETEDAIEEFIVTYLPKCFHGASYHWQLSSSAGHPSKDGGVLKAHVWFWLATPYTSSQLLAWAKATDYKADRKLFNTIQAHYTAAPVIENGAVSPVKNRSGFVDGEFSDSVILEIPENILDKASIATTSLSRHQKMQVAWANDPVAVLLHEKGLVKSYRANDGGINVVCPRSEHHTGESGESSTIYYVAHTGGNPNGHFRCLHEHCEGIHQSEFLQAIGFDDADGVFGPLTDERVIPVAKHLTTDQANANRIISNFNQKIISAADRWFAWNGARWKPDESEIMCKGMNLSAIISKEADEWDKRAAKTEEERKNNAKVADSLRAWSKKSEMSGTINAAMSMTKKVLSVEAESLDKDPWLLNCPNGTVDLRTGSMREHRAEDMITKVTAVSFNPSASYERFEAVLAKVTMEDGSANRPLMKFLKRWFGYCATASLREQKFVVHYGSGRNGKSTILDLVSDVLGDYSGTAAPDLLMSTDRGRHPTEIADLFGLRMVTAHETGEGGSLREDFVKQATGGDKLKARRMREDFFEFKPTHKLQLLTNYKPIIKGQDEGIWRRVLLVPYRAKFGTEEEVAKGIANYIRDTRIAEQLQDESEGVLRWIVEGAVEWYKDGLNPPDIVMAASKDYQTEQDRVLQFVNEVCEIGDDLTCYLTHNTYEGVYPAYQKWCKSNGVFPMHKNRFIDGLFRVVPTLRKEERKVSNASGGRSKVQVLIGLGCMDVFQL